MQYFKIEEESLRNTLCQALSQGADYADIYIDYSIMLNLSLQDGIVNRASCSIDSGAGVRAVMGNQTGYAYTEELSPAALLQAGRQAANISSSSPTAVVAPMAQKKIANRYFETGTADFDEREVARLVDFLTRMRAHMLELEPRLASISANIVHNTQRFAVINSLGDCVEDQQPMTSLSVQCVIAEGSQRERAGFSLSYRKPLSMLDDSLIHLFADKCISRARFALSAIQPKGGEMPVVLGAGDSGILLHEAIGHGFEADCVRREESIFTDQLGKRICMSGINVVDDGTLPHMRGSIHFDDEAVPSQRTPLITDGIVTSFMHDRISARHFGVEPTGNGRRESFRFPPVPRMRNTYMLGMAGTTQDDLIASVKKGIFVDNFTNGQVQIGAGDYTFYVKSGYLIEEGRLTQPIKDVNIIGNGMQTLADITGVADNAIVDPSTWMCGKEGQSCFVSCGMPSVLVKSMTVG